MKHGYVYVKRGYVIVTLAKRWTPVLFVLLASIALGVSLLFGGSTLEDAYITFRYARNFAEGAGVGVWNVGQAPVEGATSFLWMLVLGTGMQIGISPFLLSKAIGLSSLLGILLLLALLSRSAAAGGDERTSRAALGAAVLTALYIPLAWYSVTGMETTFFSLLVAMVVVSVVAMRRGFGWVLIDSTTVLLLVLVRPEGILFAIFLALYKIFCGYKDSARFIPLSVFTIAVVGVEAYRLVHFGDLLPNTYYAKATGGSMEFFLDFGTSYVHDFLKNSWPIWLVLSVGGYIAWRRRDWIRPEPMLALVVGIYFAYVLKIGGDPVSAFPLWRHFVHIAPVWLFLAGAAISRLGRDNVRTVALAAFIGLLTAATMWKETFIPASWQLGLDPGFGIRQPDNAYFDFVNRFSDSKQVVAVSLAGQWGWYVPLTAIDMLGLNNRHVAHFGTFQDDGALDSKTDMAYVMAQRPTIIDGYVSGLALREGHCPKHLFLRQGKRRNMLLGMVQSPGFLDDYYFVSNAPYEVLDRALFVSPAAVTYEAKAAGVDLVPLRDTVLSDKACAP